MSEQKAISFTSESLMALKQIGKFTARNREQDVIIDALMVYEWILHRMTIGQKIYAKNGNPEPEAEFPNFIRNKRAARDYYISRGMITP